MGGGVGETIFVLREGDRITYPSSFYEEGRDVPIFVFRGLSSWGWKIPILKMEYGGVFDALVGGIYGGIGVIFATWGRY